MLRSLACALALAALLLVPSLARAQSHNVQLNVAIEYQGSKYGVGAVVNLPDAVASAMINAGTAVSSDQPAWSPVAPAAPPNTLMANIGSVSGVRVLLGAGLATDGSSLRTTGLTVETFTVNGSAAPVTISLARPLASYASIVLTATAPMSASGDGSTPVIGDAGTAYPGDRAQWPTQGGGDMPTAAPRVVCAYACTITVNAR